MVLLFPCSLVTLFDETRSIRTAVNVVQLGLGLLWVFVAYFKVTGPTAVTPISEMRLLLLALSPAAGQIGPFLRPGCPLTVMLLSLLTSSGISSLLPPALLLNPYHIYQVVAWGLLAWGSSLAAMV
jgi:hypothetical protein